MGRTLQLQITTTDLNMAHCYAREASLVDAFLLAPVLRVADLNEISVSSPGRPALFILLDVLEQSTFALAICEEGTDEVVALCGVAPYHGQGVGTPWMLGSDQLLVVQRSFVRHSRAIIALMQHHFPFLMNWVDARNTLHVHWLKRMGFTFDDTQAQWIGEYRFNYFYRSPSCVSQQPLLHSLFRQRAPMSATNRRSVQR